MLATISTIMGCNSAVNLINADAGTRTRWVRSPLTLTRQSSTVSWLWPAVPCWPTRTSVASGHWTAVWRAAQRWPWAATKSHRATAVTVLCTASTKSVALPQFQDFQDFQLFQLEWMWWVSCPVAPIPEPSGRPRFTWPLRVAKTTKEDFRFGWPQTFQNQAIGTGCIVTTKPEKCNYEQLSWVWAVNRE